MEMNEEGKRGRARSKMNGQNDMWTGGGVNDESRSMKI